MVQYVGESDYADMQIELLTKEPQVPCKISTFLQCQYIYVGAMLFGFAAVQPTTKGWDVHLFFT